MKQIAYQKNLTVKKKASVLVVGGGPAGISAAVSCAIAQRELGGSVILLEQSGTFGGMSTLAGVPELMNFDDGKNFLSLGFGERVYSALYGESAYKREWKTVRAEELKCLYDSLALESGVEFYFYTTVVDVIMDGNRITGAVVSGREGLFVIEADVVIDCTGNASVCVSAGAEYEYGDSEGVAMSATLCSLWGGVDFSRKGRDADHIERALADGIFTKYDTCLPGIKPTYPEVGVGWGNIGHVFAVNDCDSESMTSAMIEGRRTVEEYRAFYKNYVPGCERAVLMDTANTLGIRESRRVVCEDTLTVESFYDKASRPDEIGRYSYPIDIHPMTADKGGMAQFDADVSKRHADGESYPIPYGALVPKGVANLLVAGRCIGADHSMQASVRVIPCCYITGQAAGVASAICAKEGVNAKDISIDTLKAHLTKICGK